MSITNAERIAAMVAHDPTSVKIHTVPNSSLWIVMYKTASSHPNWRCVLCNPELTTWRLVTEHITPEEHWNLFTKLVEAHFSYRFRHYLGELKKAVNQFKLNKNNYDHNQLQGTYQVSKGCSSRRSSNRKS